MGQSKVYLTSGILDNSGTPIQRPNGDAAGVDYVLATSGVIASGIQPTAWVGIGTAANQIVRLDGTAKLPAVDGSQLTNMPATLPGGVSGNLQANNGTGGFAASNRVVIVDANTVAVRQSNGTTLGTLQAGTFENPSAATVIGNATYGVTSPGPILLSVANDVLALKVTNSTGHGMVIANDALTTKFQALTAINAARDFEISAKELIFRTGTSYTERMRINTSGHTSFIGPVTASYFNLGGSTALFPSIRYSGTTAKFRLADDTADAPITAGAITASGDVIQTNGGQSITTKIDGTAKTVRLNLSNMGGNTQYIINLPNWSTSQFRVQKNGTDVLNVDGSGTLKIPGSQGIWGKTPPATQPAAIADATDAATTQSALNSLLAAIRSYGLIAT